MRIITLDQRSPMWLSWRAEGIGSSDAPAIMNASPWKRIDQLWQEKVDGQAKNKSNSAMRRGVQLEPVILEKYGRCTGRDPKPLCVVHDTHDWLKASLDGWCQEEELVCEIKAIKREDHELALAGKVPEHYIYQIEHQLLATGGKTAHYVSYNPNFPGLLQLAIVEYRAEENQERLQRLLAAEILFWELVQKKIPPVVYAKTPRARRKKAAS